MVRSRWIKGSEQMDLYPKATNRRRTGDGYRSISLSYATTGFPVASTSAAGIPSGLNGFVNSSND